MVDAIAKCDLEILLLFYKEKDIVPLKSTQDVQFYRDNIVSDRDCVHKLCMRMVYP